MAKDQKLIQIKEFKRFLNESSNEQEEVLKWWNSLDITLQTHLANEYSANFDIIETIPYDEILNIYRNEMNLTESSIPSDKKKKLKESLRWWNSLDKNLQIQLASKYLKDFDNIEKIPYNEILNMYRDEMANMLGNPLDERFLNESNDISHNSKEKLFIVSSYSGSGIPEHFNMIGDEKTTLKEYLEIVNSMKGSNYDETFVVVLAEIIRYPISFYYTRGIEIRNAKPLRVSYDIDNHNVRHYNVPENLKNDFLEKD